MQRPVHPIVKEDVIPFVILGDMQQLPSGLPLPLPLHTHINMLASAATLAKGDAVTDLEAWVYGSCT